MKEWKTYSLDLLINRGLFIGMNNREIEVALFKMLIKDGFIPFTVEVDDLYSFYSKDKNNIKVKIFYKRCV